jgi:hypothetical protein
MRASKQLRNVKVIKVQYRNTHSLLLMNSVAWRRGVGAYFFVYNDLTSISRREGDNCASSEADWVVLVQVHIMTM